MFQNPDKFLRGHAPRAKSLEKLTPVSSTSLPDTDRVVLAAKDTAEGESAQGSQYYLKSHVDNPRLAELEAYCASICRFIAPQYVPKTRGYYNQDGQTTHVASKAIADFRSNYDDPLDILDLKINNPEIHQEFIARSMGLLIKPILDYYSSKAPISGIKYNTSLRFLSSWFAAIPSHYQMQLILTQALDNRITSSITKVIEALKARIAYMKAQAVRPHDFLTEYNLLHQALPQFQAMAVMGDIEHPMYWSIKDMERLDRAARLSKIDLSQAGEQIELELDGVQYTVPSRDLINYRIIKGLGVGLTTLFISKEGDGHNGNMSKEGFTVDFDWNKANILSAYRPADVFNDQFRNIDDVKFSCNEHNIKYFPDVNEPHLFYWPTKQPDFRSLFLINFGKLLSDIDRELVDTDMLFNIVPLKIVDAALEYMSNELSENQNIIDQLNNFIRFINELGENQPLDKLIIKQKIKYLFNSILSQANEFLNQYSFHEHPLDAQKIDFYLQNAQRAVYQFIKNYESLRELFVHSAQQPTPGDELTGLDLSKIERLENLFQHSDRIVADLKNYMDEEIANVFKSFERFKRHSFTVEDNTRYKLLAGHPVFIFHKYKTLLKYVLTDPEVFRQLAELNITLSPAQSSNDNEPSIHEQLIRDEIDRIQEIRNTLISMADFKQFLKEHDQVAFELIKEELSSEQIKYSAKSRDQGYYQSLVDALDPDRLHDRFQALCRECFAEELLSSEDDVICHVRVN
ncbi:hypothetical protein [Legionella worsleiensis]|uniref:Uncharacterized protein n=2 Tax=Legionella worsleiensis TaxID=45076 RepID=A0A0W1A415_9GAMM|nr:hypothetical protein [Legionella worsleiensis]KTD76107.1 hypothetical protein Lwor_2225 [Legionella worsleiensis]STY33315.1 Uncharacterised protein [Legionella worsleiensis]